MSALIATLRDMTLRRAFLAVAVAVAVLTGCGAAEKLSPRMAVKDAANTTANQKEGSYTLSIVGSEADVNSLLNEGAPLSEEDRQGLDLLRNGHITLSRGVDTFALDIKAGDLDHAFELRYIDKKLFARADVAGLAKLLAASPDEINQTISGLASQEGFGFLSAAVAGKWISADLSALGGLVPKKANETTDYQAVKDAIGKALSEDVAIKKLDGDDAGDHYLATVASLRNFYAQVGPVLGQYMAKFLPSSDQLPPASAVPDKPANLDVWVKSGRVSRLELDMGQFAPTPPPGRVALRLDIDREAATVTAPSDAVNVDLAGLLGKLLNQFGGLLQGAAAGGINFD